ncbi:calcium-translocating P-type ATPase, SERCA-type [Fictibacillus sp. KIGAM418]|uniref:P-type Ca(2+) transporter n=1 Tax=Fictibacillus marinisediminis TaxID=2878389 RepID=A0A9X1X9Y7_9BACL|nr:calcium-translocating P-type ATPase, SERCA-type [Fictibacillus marinisediminis]MCK6256952.1 calcium-translocating P-type ATPase, SERCA-type [Fictibacillus marinisediminis]
MNWYQLSKEDVERLTNSNLQTGLSDKESQKKLKTTGHNQLQEAKKPSSILVFFAQFKDFMVLVLLAATLLSGLLGEYLDAIAIILIVIMNGILGFIQERKAEKSLTALRELSAPTAIVMRNGSWTAISAKELVPGDIVKLSAGDRVGADIRMVSARGLYIEESALTGESIPVQKRGEALQGSGLPLGDQANMAFMGTMVTRGSGTGVVIATGMTTEMGKIAHLIQNADTLATPLQLKLEQLGKILIGIALLLTVLVVVTGVYRGHDLYSMVLAGVSLAVAAIPEGLPAIVTIALALGVQKMIKRRAIVRKLPSVETLGCATVICSDKTGTLTQNKMTVTHLWSEGTIWNVTGSGYDTAGEFIRNGQKTRIDQHEGLLQLLSYGAICNNAELTDSGSIMGDPTETALLISAAKAGLMKDNILRSVEILDEVPFDSARKMMSVIVRNQNNEMFLITKGAPDVLLEKSDYVLWDGKRQLLKQQHTEQIKEAILGLGSQALRTIAVAYKPLHTKERAAAGPSAENHLTFIGLQGMIDPPREEVKESIDRCHEAGIKTVMITGDHVVTASAIARQLNILPQGGKVIDGAALSVMSDEDLIREAENIFVYARVSPEHKLKIVKALQKRGHIVAMTGDGVNDAPAIKSANIGIAMGITGTDVAKEASSLVLSDDNFSTIRAAIEEGRNIYENIRKFIRYLLASNVGEILVMLFAMILSMPMPLVPIQILWVNLVTDGLPAMALGIDPAEDNVMKRSPRKPNEGVFSRGLGWKIVSRGFMIGIVTILAFWTALHEHPDQLMKAQTVAFSTLVMAQLIHVFDCRSERSVLHRNPFGNMALVLAVLSSVLLTLVVMYITPLQAIFHTVPLSGRDWLLVLGMAAIPTFALTGFQAFKKL